MDEVDFSQERQDMELRRLLSVHAYALPKGAAAKECLDCGESIPEERRQAAPGCTRCIGCQHRHERQLKRYR